MGLYKAGLSRTCRAGGSWAWRTLARPPHTDGPDPHAFPLRTQLGTTASRTLRHALVPQGVRHHGLHGAVLPGVLLGAAAPHGRAGDDAHAGGGRLGAVHSRGLFRLCLAVGVCIASPGPDAQPAGTDPLWPVGRG